MVSIQHIPLYSLQSQIEALLSGKMYTVYLLPTDLSCSSGSNAAFEDGGRFFFNIRSGVDVIREAFILANYYDSKYNYIHMCGL